MGHKWELGHKMGHKVGHKKRYKSNYIWILAKSLDMKEVWARAFECYIKLKFFQFYSFSIVYLKQEEQKWSQK